METIWEYLGFLAVLLLIVFIVRYYYGDGVSEYGRLLDEMPNDYSHFDDKMLRQYIELTTTKIIMLDEKMQKTTWLKRRKLYMLKRKLEAIRQELLEFERSASALEALKHKTGQ